MLRFWSSTAGVLLTGTALFAAEVQVQVKPSPTPAARSSASPSATPRPAGSPSATSRPGGTPSATPAPAKLPQYRPALLGTGPNSVINRLDTAGLIRDGQKDAQLFFCCSVDKEGVITNTWIYRQSPDSTLLEKELFSCLDTAFFVPAVYNHERVDVLLYGTVTFKVVDGKPRLRIFENQEAEELKKESDFIGPQPFVGKDSKFEGLHYPDDAVTAELSGIVELAMKIDATGALKDLQIVSEYPPLVGFRRAAAEDFRVASFIPAFRDGKPVECSITLPVYYEP
ncbi:MAG: energy transducer TonB [Verrucomicrobiota bacterium]|nr:energy transducer TonB [Verrucomicrobiota bacterium]